MRNIRLLFLSLSVTWTVPVLAAAESSRQPLKIGWSGPLTGNSAVLGIDSRKAIQMVFDKANSEPNGKVLFQLVAEDDVYNTAKSLTAYRKLADLDKVPAVIFLTYGGLFSVALQATRDDVLIIDPLDCNEVVAKLPDPVICIAAMTEGIGKLNAERALKSGHHKAAILYFQDDPFMATVAESTKSTLQAGGGSVQVEEGYNGNQSDFRALLLKVKRAGADSLYFYGYDEAAAAMKQARQLGLTMQFYATATVMSPPFVAAAGDALEGTEFSVFTPGDESAYEAFQKMFVTKYGSPPILDIATVPSFDIANIIVDFARGYSGDTQSRDFRTALRTHLSQIRDYRGASGTISVDSDGATRSLKLATYRVESGKRRRL